MRNSFINREHDRWGFKTVFHVLMGLVIFIAGNILASLPVDLFFSVTGMQSSVLAVILRSLLVIIVLIAMVVFYIRDTLKLPLSEFRIGKPQNIMGWILCAIVLPLAVSAFFVLFVPGTFAFSEFNRDQTVRIIASAVFGPCLAAGITEELIFRGFIMHILELRWGKAAAVFVPSVLFGLLHIMNMEAPDAIDILMLVLAGTAVGIMFSLIAIQSSSIWAGAVVHGIWNLIIIGGILEISVEPFSSIFTYTLQSNSNLITGGAFGIESSLPAVIGYGCVICLALFLNRKNKK